MKLNLLHLLIFIPAFTMNCMPQKMVISCPVASLRTMPQESTGQENDEKLSRDMFGRFYDKFVAMLPPAYRDPIQDSQLLYNEQILCLEELPNNWLKIEALEQTNFNRKNKNWENLQGYIKKAQTQPVDTFEQPNIVVCKPTAKVNCDFGRSITLSIGTKLRGVQTLHDSYHVTLLNGAKGYINSSDVTLFKKYDPDAIQDLRENIVACAKELIGSLYSWGGRSYHCDCSGLINLAYRCNWIEIPRNANPMFLRSTKIENGSELQLADLIFFANSDTPERISHVLMYIGHDKIIESCLEGVVVRNATERFGKSLTELYYGNTIQSNNNNYIIYFGSLL